MTNQEKTLHVIQDLAEALNNDALRALAKDVESNQAEWYRTLGAINNAIAEYANRSGHYKQADYKVAKAAFSAACEKYGLELDVLQG